ncbi:Lcl C-terminal domain-containing protein [Salinibius halmophilus]|uniref:Lcl C-terminal domain-containing protein n=1 Tax=Salinibius halmophilus TaxID=1853216 RepID=UPI000E66E29F|nr:DUF1566 domain-containing protein [Salinibius halmophilus]
MAKTIIKATPLLLAGIVLAGCNSSGGGGEQAPQPADPTPVVTATPIATPTPTPTPRATLPPTPIPSPRANSETVLNDTGMLKCGDVASLQSTGRQGSGISYTNNEDCIYYYDEGGDPIPQGQDGRVGRDSTNFDDTDGTAGFSFTKLAADGGGDLAQNSSSWGCVRDEVSGLIWEVKDDTSITSPSFPEFTFSWFSSSSSADGNGVNGGRQGEGICNDSEFSPLERCDTEDFINKINESQLCGLTNWRLPTRTELLGLVDYGFNDSPDGLRNAAIDMKFFPGTRPDQYWVSSPAITLDNTVEAIGYNSFIGYTVDFETGLLVKSWRNNEDPNQIGKHRVRLVSDGFGE